MEISHDGEITAVLIDSRFDTLTSKEIESKLLEVVDGGSKKILIDFSKTEYISSAGLRVMLSVAKKLQKNGGKIVLSCMKPFVYDVFKMAGFVQIFQIYDNKEQAAANLK